MKTEKVGSIISVTIQLLKTKAENTNSNYKNIKLDPFVYVTAPPDGIWEFDLTGEVPPITDNIMTPVSTEYVWKNIPNSVKGVKVYAISNSVTKKL